MIVTQKAIARRTVLRGLGVTLALPMLDAMVPAFAQPKPTLRFGAVYVPNGVWMRSFTPAIEGAGFDLTPILEPLRPVRDQLLVISGLTNQEAYSWVGEGMGDHSRGITAFLTGMHAKKTESHPELLGKNGQSAHPSVDQLIAQANAASTQFPSLELGTDSGETLGSCDAGYACAFLRTMSWRSPTTPNPTENNPRAVFERLFGAMGTTESTVRLARIQTNRSLLDSVLDKLSGLKRRLSVGDTIKLDAYVDAVRAVERRIQLAEQQSARELPVVDQPAGIPATFEEHIKLLYDLQVLAFQTDLTRVFTMVTTHEVSGRSYPEIGVSDGHHALSHNVADPAAIVQQVKLNTYHVAMFAHFVEKLKATTDGDGTLLDHSVFVYGSGISIGNIHSHHDLPIILVGGCGGQIKGGRHLRYPKETPLANLYLTLLGKYGLPGEQFGDSNGQLRELSV